MRARNVRPSAWHAHRLIQTGTQWRTVPGPALDALAMGALALGSLFGSDVARAGLAGASYELTRKALEKKP